MVTMASTVEANSLSHIAAVASCPPPHPNGPAPAPALPLVLYIARVPGSRDVFLTPIKPRDKVVSAEDVQSSLYYVHINCEDDRQILHPAEDAPLSSVNADAARLPSINENGIRRKSPPPLPARRSARPESLPYPVDDKMPGLRGPPSPQKHQQVMRKPVVNDVSNMQIPPAQHLNLPVIPSRPLPNLPYSQTRQTSLHADNVRLLRQADHSDENNPYFRRYSTPVDSTTVLDSTVATAEVGTLTLIRRDPASNGQWNVASIHDPPVHEFSSVSLLSPGAARRTKKGGAPVYLDITNTGYSQFIDTDRADSRISTSTNNSSDTEPPPDGTFRRRLYMPGSRYADHGYRHGNSEPVDSASSFEMRRTMRERTLSDLTANAAVKVDRRSRSYSFFSPWDGKCEFSTGATGKSLKCRHTTSQQRTVEVSELRFNLPTSARNTPTPNADKRSSYFSHMRSSHADDYWDGSPSPGLMMDDRGRLDLSLGQERAGGGFGGKQAKLGKLIIEPEGLKMLDLLVAANVGLWWRAYERV